MNQTTEGNHPATSHTTPLAAPPTTTTPSPSTTTRRHHLLPSGSRRSLSARSLTVTPAAIAATAQSALNHNTTTTTTNSTPNDDDNDHTTTSHPSSTSPNNPPPSPTHPTTPLLTTLCYRGIELIITASHRTLLVTLTRTRTPIQSLEPPGGQIVALVANGSTGTICAASSEGVVYVYHPMRVDPSQGLTVDGMATTLDARERDQSVMCFARWRWITARIVRGSAVFGALDGGEGVGGMVRFGREGGEGAVMVSVSRDSKVLLGYGDQMAVFDGSSPWEESSGSSSHGVSERSSQSLSGIGGSIVGPGGVGGGLSAGGSAVEAPLLWIVRLHAKVLQAAISGDGRAIAAVLEGEGEGVPYPYGVRTYLRDADDGATLSQKNHKIKWSLGTVGEEPSSSTDNPHPPSSQPLQKNPSGKTFLHHDTGIGILYKPGPFLVHSTPVTRLSWRGAPLSDSPPHAHHHNHPSSCSTGNDLLLTHCRDDSSMRIFSQGTAKQLMHWTAPPGSRADWIEGISLANLGDLENKQKDNDGSTVDTPAPRGTPTPTTHSVFESTTPTIPLISHQPTPSTSAGAWISELTFRGSFPALRLSRLSYMKSAGNDYHPAHFESVAAILPPGALHAGSVLEGRDVFFVQGMWPVWNGWGDSRDGGKELMGVGSHSPPSELRIVGSHEEGSVVVLEFPLWGDKDFGAMEFGSPLKYVLALDEDFEEEDDGGGPVSSLATSRPRSRRRLSLPPSSDGAATHTPPMACLSFEDSRLCARVDPHHNNNNSITIRLTWRREGSTSLLPIATPLKRAISSASFHSLQSAASQYDDDYDVERYADVSVTPLPLSLPPIVHQSPREGTGNGKGSHSHSHNNGVRGLRWWPDENFGGPPRLFVLTTGGTLVLYEMPPPWSALEPPMPSYDPFHGAESSIGSAADMGCFDDPIDDNKNPIVDDRQDDDDILRKEYNVVITPHHDFGIGLRLEAQPHGHPAIAGSYKKHPLSGGKLPAERCGMIVLGDELLAVNEQSLEGMSFEDIIATVRKIGAGSAGQPLTMRFRPGKQQLQQLSKSSDGLVLSPEEAAVVAGSDVISYTSTGTPTRRSIFNHRDNDDRSSDNDLSLPDDSNSCASGANSAAGTIMVGAEGEVQQAFCRIVASVPKALPEHFRDEAVVILPWNYGVGCADASSGSESGGSVRGVSLIVVGMGNVIMVKRMAVTQDAYPENVRYNELGRARLSEAERETTGGSSGTGSVSPSIQSLSVVKTTTTNSWCLAAIDTSGQVTLVVVTVKPKQTDNNNSEELFTASFKICPVFNANTTKTPPPDGYLLRAHSVQLLACLPLHRIRSDLTIWLAAPKANSLTTSPFLSDTYHPVTLPTGVHSMEDSILDFRWMSGGNLDAFPMILSFTKTSVTLFRRPGGSFQWTAVVQLYYPLLASSAPGGRGGGYGGIWDPADVYPHLIPSLREMVGRMSDERRYQRADWHPEAIVAQLGCDDEYGVKGCLEGGVKGLFRWLARWMSRDEREVPRFNPEFSLGIAPLKSVWDAMMEEGMEDGKGMVTGEMMKELQRALLLRATGLEEREVVTVKANEQVVDLPVPLKPLNNDEIYFLWVISRMLEQPPSLDKLDVRAQLTLFSVTLLHHLTNKDKADSNDENTSPTPNTPTCGITTPTATFNSPATLPRPQITISHSSALSALLSSTPTPLLTHIRTTLQPSSSPSTTTFDWPTARSLLLPFWIRPLPTLRLIAEEIAQHRFKKTKSAMECALFYIALRKIPTLQNFARTDRSESGERLAKFLQNFDFRSERGRVAAQKNAFSLLRKRMYGVAAAFFLLAEPPFLRSAMEVMVNQMEDVVLAFFVARLVEGSQQSGEIGGGGFGRMSGFGGLSGFGGGGFGSTSFNDGSDSSADAPFDKWTPDIGDGARNLLEDRVLPLYGKTDPHLAAICHLWLGRPDEAALSLAGRTTNALGQFEDQVDMIVPPSFDELKMKPTRKFKRRNVPEGPVLVAVMTPESTPGERVALKTNAILDFVSRPGILKAMKAPKKLRWSATLHVGRALGRRGLELGCLKTVLGCSDPKDVTEEREVDEREGMERRSSAVVNDGGMNSSIFDSFEAAPSPKPKPRSMLDSFDTTPMRGNKQQSAATDPAAGAMSSSIFDSFDAPRPKPIPKPAASGTAAGDMSSSIFDSFDVPKPKPVAAPSSGEMTSSIFDSFDTPRPKPKPEVAAPSSGEMSSSIFDSFDAPRPKPKPVVAAPSSGEMTSSIFDSFDAPRPKPKPVVAAPSSGEMSSSIFDSFDAPKPKPKPVVAAHSSGEMTSSIFDSFDTPQPKSKPHHPTTSKPVSNTPPTPKKALDQPIPPLWLEWRTHNLAQAVARRLIREIARVVSRFQGDALIPPMARFKKHKYALVPYGAAQVLQVQCDGTTLLRSIRGTLEELCLACDLSEESVIEQALSLVGGGCHGGRRIVFSVLLYGLMGRSDLAEDVVRDAAHGQIRLCESFTSCNDDLVRNRRTSFHAASQYVRRRAAIVSWQLELCLWLNRGGCMPLTGVAMKETIIAVRVGLLVASWGRNHESLEALIKCDPDCIMDHEAGRQLWTNMKIINTEGNVKPTGVCSSGGWEFLVDCRRDEATAMLRDRKPGTFLLRPHPEDHGVFTLSFKTNLISVVPSAKPSSENAEATTAPAAATSATPQQNGKVDHDNDDENVEDDGKVVGDLVVGFPEKRRSNDEVQVKVDGNKQTSSKPTKAKPNGTPAKPPKSITSDDVVQHAIIRLSDAGFRCGSFGPFPSLMRLLETVSASLPFELLFNEPPAQGIIKEQGTQPSPNSFFLRKVALHSKSEQYKWNSHTSSELRDSVTSIMDDARDIIDTEDDGDLKQHGEKRDAEMALRKRFGMFSQLLVLMEVRRQLSAIAAGDFEDMLPEEDTFWQQQEQPSEDVAYTTNNNFIQLENPVDDPDDFEKEQEEICANASRMIRPLLEWCRAMEVLLVPDIAPSMSSVQPTTASLPVAVAANETAIEAAPFGSSICGGDAVIRRMIQPGSGVEFRTLRVGEVGHSAIVVLFSKDEAIDWLIQFGAEHDRANAEARLKRMEKRRVIEEVDLAKLRETPDKTFSLTSSGTEIKKDEIRYRFVDPWEVEALDTREAGAMAATLGREHLLAFNLGLVARACDKVLRSVNGVHLLSLWSSSKGGIFLTKAISSIHPPWERDVGIDLRMENGKVSEPTPIMNSIRKHLYRNALFRRLRVPQRFIALLQIELLDLKNLTSPGGSTPLTAYALLRLKRTGSSAPLTHKARTLDSAATRPRKICKTSGPNAPASWGSVVRFRFTLPEDVNCDGVSFDMDREALFRGPPSVLQLSVYEKKFMSDTMLGGADVKLDALGCGDQLEEWVPLRAGKNGITWFARIRIILRFELLCLDTEETDPSSSVENSSDRFERCPSVGLRKLKELSHHGGAHEDNKAVKKSVSTPDFFSYLESMAAL